MVSVLSYSILSPLGNTATDNFNAVLQGHLSVHGWHGRWGVPTDFMASLFSDEQTVLAQQKGFTRLESFAWTSIMDAIRQTKCTLSPKRTVLIFSTTKGNVELLGTEEDNGRFLPVSSAKLISGKLGLETEPIVVDNACISSLSALILAQRLLESEFYDYAVVCGVECQSKFIISGFQSLKAMSPAPCRPFDMERNGLNLGEAAATMILGHEEGCGWKLSTGVVRNDAFHLSAPAKDGIGATMALKRVTEDVPGKEIAFINAHGTATLFNDQMESVAIERAGLSDVLVNGYKGCYGHTMGACGILETIVSMEAINHGVVLPTKGFSELGVSGNVKVLGDKVLGVNGLPGTGSCSRLNFVKMLSGFGGCNAALLVTKNLHAQSAETQFNHPEVKLKQTHHVHILPSSVKIDGKVIETVAVGKPMLTELYKRYVGNYPRFYKMDMLGRLGFMATELLLKEEGKERFAEEVSRAVVFVGRSGSIVADRIYYDSIKDLDNYYPSPGRFVYTLPNIVTGEIAIRNHYHGETAYYSIPHEDAAIIHQIIYATFLDTDTQSVIGGWLECEEENNFEADIYITEKE